MSDLQQPSPSEQPAQQPTVESLSYEAARDELVSIVSRLESGQLGLEESMTLWERGEALADHCTRWLDGAQARLTRAEDEASPTQTGNPVTVESSEQPTTDDDGD